MNTVVRHYDILIDEGQDPVHDPKILQDYMDKWDGQVFIDKMHLDNTKSVLEIGVGTGRLAVRTAPICKTFCGIDISPKTVEKAGRNLSKHSNITLICDDFMSFEFTESFDIIYSSLTFMHISEKQKCINKIASMLNPNGIFALSTDKNQTDFIDMGTRKIPVYPDNPTETEKYITESGLKLSEKYETEFAYIFICTKP